MTVLIQATVATSYYPRSSLPPAQHHGADILQPLMWWLLLKGKQSSASLGAGCLSSVKRAWKGASQLHQEEEVEATSCHHGKGMQCFLTTEMKFSSWANGSH